MSKLEEIRRMLLVHLEGCRQSLRDFAEEKDPAWGQVANATEEELPTLLEKGLGEWAGRRLKGEDIDTPETWKEILADSEFSYDDAKLMSANDGELGLLCRLLLLLGEEDAEKEARSYIYG